MDKGYINLIFSDSENNIFDHPYIKAIGRSGDRLVIPDAEELVPLPEGSQLFSLPGRIPIGWDEEKKDLILLKTLKIGTKDLACTAVSAFLPPGYVRTLIPAAKKLPNAPILPLWAYSCVGWKEGKFWVTGIMVDPNPRWDIKHFNNDELLKKKVRLFLKKSPKNRLLKQLSICALSYNCFAAKNVFFQRWECPLPTSPSCNANCIGCISLQPSECCPASQERIDFIPTVDEILEITVPHLCKAEDPIVSFGQGCEGEPLIQWRLIEQSIKKMREKTDRGTINLNTNGSIPEYVRIICKAGLDSIRVTLNSADLKYFRRYHRPNGYGLNEIISSLIIAKELGVYTSINLLVFPGFTDRESEIDKLIKFIEITQIDLIQMRNLNIDPDLYLKVVGKGEGIGISKMIKILKDEFPWLKFGYFNKIKEEFNEEYPLNKKDF